MRTYFNDDGTTRVVRKGVPNSHLDERDLAILQQRLDDWANRDGARVGDWIKMLDGTLRRFSHKYDDGLQVTTGDGDNGSFYLAWSLLGAWMDYSGGLDPFIPDTNIRECPGVYRSGSCWFFHHDLRGPGRGVNATAFLCRVYEEIKP